MQPFGTSRCVLRTGHTRTTAYALVGISSFGANLRLNLGFGRAVPLRMTHFRTITADTRG